MRVPLLTAVAHTPWTPEHPVICSAVHSPTPALWRLLPQSLHLGQLLHCPLLGWPSSRAWMRCGGSSTCPSFFLGFSVSLAFSGVAAGRAAWDPWRALGAWGRVPQRHLLKSPASISCGCLLLFYASGHLWLSWREACFTSFRSGWGDGCGGLRAPSRGSSGLPWKSFTYLFS